MSEVPNINNNMLNFVNGQNYYSFYNNYTSESPTQMPNHKTSYDNLNASYITTAKSTNDCNNNQHNQHREHVDKNITNRKTTRSDNQGGSLMTNNQNSNNSINSNSDGQSTVDLMKTLDPKTSQIMDNTAEDGSQHLARIKHISTKAGDEASNKIFKIPGENTSISRDKHKSQSINNSTKHHPINQIKNKRNESLTKSNDIFHANNKTQTFTKCGLKQDGICTEVTKSISEKDDSFAHYYSKTIPINLPDISHQTQPFTSNIDNNPPTSHTFDNFNDTPKKYRDPFLITTPRKTFEDAIRQVESSNKSSNFDINYLNQKIINPSITKSNLNQQQMNASQSLTKKSANYDTATFSPSPVASGSPTPTPRSVTSSLRSSPTLLRYTPSARVVNNQSKKQKSSEKNVGILNKSNIDRLLNENNSVYRHNITKNNNKNNNNLKSNNNSNSLHSVEESLNQILTCRIQSKLGLSEYQGLNLHTILTNAQQIALKNGQSYRQKENNNKMGRPNQINLSSSVEQVEETTLPLIDLRSHLNN